MRCTDLCRRGLLGIAFSFACAAFADDASVDLGTARDFVDVTADLTFQSAASDTTDPDPALFRPVASNPHVFERYDGSYWFKLELANGSTAPVPRLLELTHGRLGLLVARVRSGGEQRELLRTGVGMKLATRAVSFPNAVIPFDVAPQSRATLLIYAASRDNMVLSARLWTEAGFGAYQLRHELVVGAGLGAFRHRRPRRRRQSYESPRRRQNAEQLGCHRSFRRKRPGSHRNVRQPREGHRRRIDGLRNAGNGRLFGDAPHPHPRTARRGATPIIAFTAHAMPEFRRRAEEAGMTDYVTKPIQKSTLLKAMLNTRAKSASSDPAQIRH